MFVFFPPLFLTQRMSPHPSGLCFVFMPWNKHDKTQPYQLDALALRSPSNCCLWVQLWSYSTNTSFHLSVHLQQKYFATQSLIVVHNDVTFLLSDLMVWNSVSALKVWLLPWKLWLFKRFSVYCFKVCLGKLVCLINFRLGFPKALHCFIWHCIKYPAAWHIIILYLFLLFSGEGEHLGYIYIYFFVLFACDATWFQYQITL